ncbi:hypothetical protein [Occultella gossypii]|uniref:Uncharacterized protein n=1 Tax=Occultella gossypii TaxID=2800820 RepID=A0ABS7SF72_9MICO|nr:hypothetical protein [Occultella gossypii]MBZ2199005.1 hypothetical protein [Occultella gossypii]
MRVSLRALLGLVRTKDRPAAQTQDELAVVRYDYLLGRTRTADLERVHTRAYANLTEDQRDLLFDQLLARASAWSEQPSRTTSHAPSAPSPDRKNRTNGRLRRWFGLDLTGGPAGPGSADSVFGAIFALGVPFFWFSQPTPPPDEPTDHRRAGS